MYSYHSHASDLWCEMLRPRGDIVISRKTGTRETMLITRLLMAFGVILLVPSAWLLAAGGPPFPITLHNVPPFYEPASAQVPAGTGIQWQNATDMHHTITHDGCTARQRCLFESGPIPPSRSFTVSSLPPGTYPYHCEIHPFMRGVISVSAPSWKPEQM